MQILDVAHKTSRRLKYFDGIALFIGCIAVFSIPNVVIVRIFSAGLIVLAALLMHRQIRFLDNLQRIQMTKSAVTLVVDNKKCPVRIVSAVFVCESLVAFTCCERNKTSIFWLINAMPIVVLSDSMSAHERRLLRRFLISHASDYRKNADHQL